jgi:hypothetical protein
MQKNPPPGNSKMPKQLGDDVGDNYKFFMMLRKTLCAVRILLPTGSHGPFQLAEKGVEFSPVLILLGEPTMLAGDDVL